MIYTVIRCGHSLPPSPPIFLTIFMCALSLLYRCQRHRVVWALWLTCWQMVCRTGDVLKRKHRVHDAWEPSLDMHRGRFELSRVAGSGRLRASIRLPPGKTDAPGEQGVTKTALVDANERALSCGTALAHMLLGDPLAPGEERELTPLFRDPATGKEISYSWAAALLREALIAVGHAEVAAGPHSLRRGGGTAAGAVGGRYVSACMGNWRSDSDARYLFPLRERCEAATYAMALADAGPLADGLGPVVVRR